jgi:pyruvate,water dikinase
VPSAPFALPKFPRHVWPLTDVASTVFPLTSRANVGLIFPRELGIPYVVPAIDATVRIPDGALLEVDGTTGTVTVLAVR